MSLSRCTATLAATRDRTEPAEIKALHDCAESARECAAVICSDLQ
jgi:hypothetical protein